MDIDHLVHLDHRIGDFFAGMRDHAEALDRVATHVRKFRERHMRRQILEHLDARQGAGLSDRCARRGRPTAPN